MTVETKEIGIPTGMNKGKFNNTEYVNGIIKLKQTSSLDDGTPIYAKSGYWESDVIDLEGKFKDYDSVAISTTQQKSDGYTVLTKTSNDGSSFDNYVKLSSDGKVQSSMKRFIQIKIELTAGTTNKNVVISDFNSKGEANEWEDSTYIDTSNGLRLKTDYSFKMNQDTSWSESGSLHRKKINKNNWKQINSINIG